VTSPLGSADSVQVAIVPDFARFPAELRRGVDQAMREFTARVDAALHGVEAGVADTARQLGTDFQVGGEVAERAFRELDSTARREMASVEATTAAAAASTGRRFQAAGALAGTAFLGAGVAIAAGLGLLTAMGLKSAATLEQTQIAFNALLGSAQLGQQVFKDLQQFAAVTPFQFTEITPVAQRFFTFADALGMTKLQVREFLTVLGDLASVTGSGAFGMERAALAMSQMAAKGRLSAQDVNQLADAFPGFNVRAAIAHQLGMSVADTMTAMENGTIDAKTGLQALMKGMAEFPGAAGAMEKQSQTLLGVWSTFKDVFSQALVAGFAPVIPQIKQTLTDITPILGEAIAGLAPVLGGLLTGVLKLVGPLVKALSAGILPLINALGKAIDDIDPKVWDQLTLAMGQLGESLAPLIPVLVEFLVALLEIAIPALLLVAEAIKPTIPLLDLMARSIHELNRALAMIDWAAVGRAIAGFFVDLWHTVSDFFIGLWKNFTQVNEKASAGFAAFRESAANHINAMIANIKALPGRVVASLGGFGDLLVQKGKDLIAGLWAGIRGMAGWLAAKVKQFAYDNTVGVLKSTLGIGSPSTVMADQIGRWIPAGIGMGVNTGLPALRAQLAGVGAGIPAAAGAGAAMAGGPSISFGPGSVVVQFTGAAPTGQQAFDTGIRVGQGIMDAINRRGVATATKQRA
jgi:tape measure domain-containing protein